MIKLLNFFIPNVIKNILFMYVIAVIASLMIVISPLEQEGDYFLSGSVIFLMFPAYVYFNSSNYLSASLSWILQTPTPKLSIILTNGILNLIKVLMISGLILLSIASVLVFKNGFVGLSDALPSLSSLSNQVITVVDFYSILIFLSFVFSILFGILPDLLGSAQEKRNQNQPLNLKTLRSSKNLKKVIFFLFLLVSAALFGDTEIPDFLFSNFLVVIVCISVIGMTLYSVKYFFSGKKLILSGVGLFLLGSFISIQVGNLQIRDSSISLKDRIDVHKFLGDFNENGEEVILSEIAGGTYSSKDLSKSDIIVMVQAPKNIAMVEKTLNELIEKCNLQNDHTCRLASHIASISPYKTSIKSDIELLKKGCPKDLGSCVLLASSLAGSPEEQQAVHLVLVNECKAKKDSLNKKICDRYFRERMKKSK